jgi:hypothetical protein
LRASPDRPDTDLGGTEAARGSFKKLRQERRWIRFFIFRLLSGSNSNQKKED